MIDPFHYYEKEEDEKSDVEEFSINLRSVKKLEPNYNPKLI
jgi:hypothetical protein